MKFFFQFRQDEITDGTAFRTIDVLADCEDEARALASEDAAAKDDASAELWLNAERSTLTRTTLDPDVEDGVCLVAFSDTGA